MESQEKSEGKSLKRIKLEQEFNELKAKVARWYIQMGKAKDFRKFYKIREKITRAVEKGKQIQFDIASFR